MTHRPAGSKQLIRRINESLILDTLRKRGTMSRSGLSQEAGLSAATVTGIAARLIASNYLEETETISVGVGRPAQLVALSESRYRAVGVRIANGSVHAASVTLNGRVAATEAAPWSGEAVDVVPAIRAAIDALRRSEGDSIEYLGVGLSVSGVVDRASGTVVYSGTLGWRDVPLGDWVRESVGLPVFIDNYVSAIASWMTLFGLSRGDSSEDLMIVNVGPSIGLSVVTDGQVHRGANGRAGAFAHSRAPRTTALQPPLSCHCGRVDCLEVLASQWGLEAALDREGAKPGPWDTRDDWSPAAQRIVSESAEILATAISNATLLIDPAQVLIIRPDNRLGSSYVDEVVSTYRNITTPTGTSPSSIDTIPFDDVVIARGAACDVLSQLFRGDPREATVI